MSDEPPVVLIVEDERDLATLYAEWLSNEYDVRTAYNGSEALDELAEEVSVVLLDRRMPDLSGDEVLDEIRDRGLECSVAMVTAIEPDFDILEMGFDDYLVKPVSREDLLETVDRLLTRTTYDSQLQKYFSLVSKKAVLETEKSSAELDRSEEYAELQTEIDGLREQIDTTLEQLEDEDFHAVFQSMDAPPEGSE